MSNNSGDDSGSADKAKSLTKMKFSTLKLFLKPKIWIPILLIVALMLYFLTLNNNTILGSKGKYGLGCGMDPEKYDNTMVYEPLASSSNKNKIPASISLLKYAPTRKNQGEQGSCVGWASAYAARTILEAYSTGKNPDELAFSPSFLFNQIALPGCQGSYTSEALEIMKLQGLVPYNKFKYDEENCSNKPNSVLLAEAKNFKIRGYNRLSKGGSNYDVDIEALKQNLAQGAPVIIAMKVPASFYELNSDIWIPQKSEYRRLDKLGGHAMCAIGYDDNKFGGAVQVMNSWGRNWANDGVFWIKYTDFAKFVREAYGIFPIPKKSDDEFDVSFGLVYADNNTEIPLNQSVGNLLRTRNPIKKGDRYKIEVQNNVECYIYVFGQKSDGSSNVIFPYVEEKDSKSKYSPFCGIVGARHFPGGTKSLTAESKGNQDFMAVVVSRDELDYNELNERINRIPGKDYLTKLNKAMGSMQISNPKFKLKASSVGFRANSAGSQKAVGVVIAIDKK